MTDNGEAAKIIINGTLYTIVEIVENAFIELPSITVDTGEIFIVGTYDAFVDAARKYYKEMSGVELIEYIGSEIIAYNWMNGYDFYNWLEDAANDWYNIVPSRDGITLYVDDPLEVNVQMYDADENDEYDYWESLYDLLGFYPQIAFASY